MMFLSQDIVAWRSKLSFLDNSATNLNYWYLYPTKAKQIGNVLPLGRFVLSNNKISVRIVSWKSFWPLQAPPHHQCHDPTMIQANVVTNVTDG